MTDATAGRGGVGIRLYVSGGEVVKRTFDQVGDSGKKMWAEIALGEKSANPAIRALSAGSNEARSAIDGLAGRAGPATSVLGAFGAAGVAAAAALGALTIAWTRAREAMTFAATLTDTADRIGVNVEQLQAWSYVADEAGVSVEGLQGTMEKLNGSLGKIKVGIGDAKLKPWMEELGISQEALASISTADEMLLLLADRLGQVEDRSKQVAAARAFGVEEALPVLRLGAERVRELMEEAHRLGLVLDTETIVALDAADRQIEVASQRIESQMRFAVSGLADDFADLMTHIANALAMLNRFLDRFSTYRQQADAMYGEGFVSNVAQGNSWQATKSAFRSLFSGRTASAAAHIRNGDSLAGGSDIDERAVAALGTAPASSDRPVFNMQGHTTKGGPDRAKAEADKLAREAEQRRQRQERADDQTLRADRDLSAAWNKSGHLQTIEARAGAEIQRLEEDRLQRLKELDRAEEEYVRSDGLRGLTKAEADLLRTKQNELTAVEQSLVADQERRDLAARRLKTEQEAAQAAVDLLDIDAQMASTTKERSRIEREILLATIEIARRAKQRELELDPELDDSQRAAGMATFERGANRRVQLFDFQEDERIKGQFKSYGREVVQAIEDGRLGEKIGAELKANMLDWLLDQAAGLFRGGAGQGADGAGNWMSKAANAAMSWFSKGGGRASGGGTEQGRFYTTVEHGRPELFMIGGSGHVTSAAETARMVRDVMGDHGSSQAGQPLAPVVNMPDITINAPGADAAALSRVEAEVRQLREEMPGMAVQAVRDANERRIGG